MTTKYQFEEIRAFIEELLKKGGLPADRAKRIADAQTEVEAFGVTTHGLTVASAYINMLQKAPEKATGEIKTLNDFGAVTTLDASAVFGLEGILAARDIVEEKARKHGIAITSILRTSWVGVIGYHLAALARKGYLCMAWAQMSGYTCVAPFGGREGRVSTSPMALVMPNDPDPVVADFSTSAVASGKVWRWLSEGKKAPEPLFYDGEGKLSDEPQVFKDHQAMLPFGGAKSGFRGTALSVWIEALTAAAGGIAAGKGGGQNAHILAIHADAMSGGQDTRDEWNRFRDYLLSSPPAQGMNGPTLPGGFEWPRFHDAQANGLTLHPDLEKSLKEMAQDFGVPFPEAV